MSDFHLVTGPVARGILDRSPAKVRRIVADAYRAHDAGETINPDSYFLRFPSKPDSRVIALPAHLGGAVDRIGIKWISSFPRNLDAGLPRASAVLILNDSATGRPIACLESAAVSAARTAASAALAAEALSRTARSVAFVGAGVIARAILAQLATLPLPPTEVACCDLRPDRRDAFLAEAGERHGVRTRAVELAEACAADLVVFTTTAGRPYVDPGTRFKPGQVVLNVSLRDLAPQTLLEAANVVDDVDHCLKADTSPHLVEQLTGNREFITGTLGALLRGRLTVPDDRPIIFSPFGLGVLDIAVGSHVLDTAVAEGEAIAIPRFLD